ncbi:MAG: Hpt domain-containing protein [Azonexus sp.]|nr:Hpt domain-containing protein [Azonexus sp.]
MNPFVIDKPAILDRLGGDEDIFAMMLEMYLQEVDSNCQALQAALDAGNVATLQREAHTVKGLLATVSDDDGAARALALEQMGKLGQLDGAAALLGEVQTRLREVAAVLAAELGR